MGGLRISNEVILAKKEATYNTDSVPVAGTDAILIRNVDMKVDVRMAERAAVRQSLGKLQAAYGGQMRRVTFECEIKGSGAAGTIPEIAPLLRACALAETINAGTSVVYKPTSGVPESVTIYFFEGGRRRHIMTGCRGNVTFKLAAGGLALASFEFVGHYTDATDQSQPSPTYNSQVPKAGIGMTVSINGITAIVPKSWEWNLGNVIALPPSLVAADGYGDVLITGRDVKGNTVIETELDSVIDLDSLMAAGTRFAWQSGTLGSVAGNRLALVTPAASTYITDLAMQEADGLRLRQMNLAVDDSTSDQELTATFT